MADHARFSGAILLSLLLHAMFLAALPHLRRAATDARRHAPPLEVALMRLPPPAPPKAPPVPQAPKAPAVEAPPPPVILPERQIVNPPDAGEEHAPEKTRYLSDRNVSVPEEQVRRGGGGGSAAKAAAPPAAAPAMDRRAAATAERRAAERPEERVAALPSLDQLLPRAGDLIREGRLPPPVEDPKPRPRTGRDFLVSGTGALPLSPGGTADYLPTVREGNITLLNTKADLFAPFVRRVAMRVFQNLLISFSQALRSRAAIQAGRHAVTVEAVMTKEGHLVGARMLDQAGANGLAVDRRLLDAARPDIFFDANPPAGAEAADGNIHFILIADLTVQVVPNPSSGFNEPEAFGLFSVGLQ